MASARRNPARRRRRVCPLETRDTVPNRLPVGACRPCRRRPAGANLGFNRTTASDASLSRDARHRLPAAARDGEPHHAAEPPLEPLRRRRRAILPPNAATVYGLLDTQGYDSLLTGQYIALGGGHWTAARRRRRKTATWSLRTMPRPPKRTWRRRAMSSRSAPCRLLPRPYVWLFRTEKRSSTRTGGAAACPTSTAGRGRATWQDIAPTRLRVSSCLAGSRRASVIMADQWYPGWAARSREKRETVLKRPGDFSARSSWTRQNAQAKRTAYRWKCGTRRHPFAWAFTRCAWRSAESAPGYRRLGYGYAGAGSGDESPAASVLARFVAAATASSSVA